MATFLGELEEHIRALERDALALEKDPGDGRAERWKTLFRTAHSLKGAARSAGVSPIEQACHGLEAILGAARDGEVLPGAGVVQLLLSAADALEDARNRLQAREELTGGALGAFLARLEVGSFRAGALPPGRAAPPDSAAAPAGSAPEMPELPARAGTHAGFVRLPATKLDTLVARSSELLVARRRAASRQGDLAHVRELMARCLVEGRRSGHMVESLKKLERGIERLAQGLAADQRMLDVAASALEEEVQHARMLPFGEACEGLERMVRDLARAAGKDVELVVEGTDVELDRAILDGLRDPLLHLVRNAVDHGVEPPAERVARGKPARACIRVAAALAGAGVEVVVADDGPGLDLDAIREQAAKRKIPVPEEQWELVRLVLLPGFSTRRLITELSGRGVGLDVVKHRVEVLHGSVEIGFEPGRGTRVVLSLPLTLTTLRVLILRAGGQCFALPTANVRRLVRAGAGDLGAVEGREVLLSDGAPVPVVSLAETVDLAHDGQPERAERAGAKIPLVVVAAGERAIAFAVDELLDEQEVVVKSLGPRLRRVRHFAGATVLPSGRLALILAAADLVQTALGRGPGRALAPALEDQAAAAKRRVLVVDDSVTTRSLEKSMLEAAGYEVLAASDGAEAWELLQERGADLVVADVEMPRMDGFALTEAIRGSARFRDLPVVLVTSLEAERDKARGLEAGADAYLPKSAFDHTELLQVIVQLL